MPNIECITINETVVVDSRLIAQELGIQHKAFLGTIRKYQTQIESEFGHLLFETATVTNSVGAKNETTFYYLNEDQATFLMTASRNTEQVIKCKLNLVKAFSKAKALLNQQKPVLPTTYKDALLALVAEIEAKEKAEEARKLLELENQSLENENQVLSEAVDELFDYSSIIRIAKFNGIPETTFSWRKLKGASEYMGVAVKRVPCPRFVTKLLYSHDVWRYVYPDAKLPETTTLVIKAS